MHPSWFLIVLQQDNKRLTGCIGDLGSPTRREWTMPQHMHKDSLNPSSPCAVAGSIQQRWDLKHVCSPPVHTCTGAPAAQVRSSSSSSPDVLAAPDVPPPPKHTHTHLCRQLCVEGASSDDRLALALGDSSGSSSTRRARLMRRQLRVCEAGRHPVGSARVCVAAAAAGNSQSPSCGVCASAACRSASDFPHTCASTKRPLSSSASRALW